MGGAQGAGAGQAHFFRAIEDCVGEQRTAGLTGSQAPEGHGGQLPAAGAGVLQFSGEEPSCLPAVQGEPAQAELARGRGRAGGEAQVAVERIGVDLSVGSDLGRLWQGDE